MLAELSIKNFAIIDSLNVTFADGLNVISGETGAGKSIIVGAVNLLLGDRASSEMIRSSEDSAVVEARFVPAKGEKIPPWLQDMGFYENGDLVVRRIIARSGKNRAFINGNLATLNMLASLGGFLVDVCSQHEHQVLLQTDRHIDILDEFGNLLDRRNEYAGHFHQYQALKEKRNALLKANEEKGRKEELLRFQVEEIEKSDIRIGEDSALRDERKILSSAQKLRECGEAAYAALYGREGSLLEELDGVRERIREIRGIDQGFVVKEQDVDSLYFGLEDLAFGLREYLTHIRDDQGRLEEIDDRLEFLGTLKRKYGTTLEDVLVRRDAMMAELEEMTRLEEEIALCDQELSAKEALLKEMAEGLSDLRKKWAYTLEKHVEKEIHELCMETTAFKVTFAGDSAAEAPPVFTEKGIDGVEFYLSTNIGETLKPLHRIASGGELSRIVLALKKVLAAAGSVGTVIFDEVDSGIGGAAAEMVGYKLKDVANHHQVICITHLPQIACFGDTHYLVTKAVAGGRTHTEVAPLNASERLDEVARMLGGAETTETTRRHAAEMLQGSRRS